MHKISNKGFTNIGFTGSKRRVTPDRIKSLCEFLGMMDSRNNTLNFRHGDCIGWDAAAHRVVCTNTKVWIFIYPGDLPNYQAGSVLPIRGMGKRGAIEAPQPCLERNRTIVSKSDILIAAPRSTTEELRSGTWATIRYARAKGIPIVFI